MAERLPDLFMYKFHFATSQIRQNFTIREFSLIKFSTNVLIKLLYALINKFMKYWNEKD